MAKKTAEKEVTEKVTKPKKEVTEKVTKDSADETITDGKGIVPSTPPADENHAVANIAPAVMPMLKTSGFVVPQGSITGLGHDHSRIMSLGKLTSKVSSKPTTSVRFSHPGLKALVVRHFEHVNQALEFVNNPNNIPYKPVYVETDSVHPTETQEHAHKFRMAQQAPKKKGRIDASIGSPEYMEAPDEQVNATDLL